MEERRSALLVATAQYGDEQLKRLRAPVHDAQQLRDVLADPGIGGFDVTLLTDRPSYEVREQIEGFFADRSPDELLLLYFSCHGVTDTDGRLYFATADTRRQRFRATAVEAAFVQDCFHGCRSRRIVLILDCCHSGAFPAGMAGKSAGTAPVRAQLEGRGRAVLTSSDALEYAFEVNGDHIEGTGVGSAFTSALVDGLRSGGADLDGDGLISVQELYDYTYEHVRAAQPSQTPRAWIDVQGQLVVARSVRPASTETLPVELQELMRSPFSNARLAAVAELSRVLASHRPGVAAGARLALRQLSEDDSLSVQQAARTALPAEVGAPEGAAATAPAAVAGAEQADGHLERGQPGGIQWLRLVTAGACVLALLAFVPSFVDGDTISGWNLVGQAYGNAIAAAVALAAGAVLSAASLLARDTWRPAVLLALGVAEVASMLGLKGNVDTLGPTTIAYWLAFVAAIVAMLAAGYDLVTSLATKKGAGGSLRPPS